MGPTLLSRRAFLAAGALLATAGGTGAATPTRLAVLDWALAETVVALGLAPLGVAETGKYRDWIGQPSLPPGTRDLGLLTEPNLELLQQLAPDLILVGDGQEASIGHRLRRIAPTLPMTLYDGGGRPFSRAKAETLRLAERLGRPAAARALIGEAEAEIEAQRQALADGERRPVVFYLFLDERHGWVADGGGLVQEMLEALGLRNAWPGPPSYWGFTPVGIDALAGVDGEALLLHGDYFMRDATAVLGSPLWRGLAPVRHGRTAAVPRFWTFGGVPTAMRLAGKLVGAVIAAEEGGA